LIVGLFIGAVATYALGPSLTRTTRATKTLPTSAQQVVTGLIVQFVGDLNDSNSEPLVGLYTNSSIVKWYGNQVPFELNGTYKEQDNIAGTDSAVYTVFLEESHGISPSNVTISFTNLITTMINSNTVNSTFRIVVTGWNFVYGPINAEANVRQQWVNQSGNWTIHTDSWDYLFSTVPGRFSA
jgi:hypothetical protein